MPSSLAQEAISTYQTSADERGVTGGVSVLYLGQTKGCPGGASTPQGNDRTTEEVAGMPQYNTRAQQPRNNDTPIGKKIRQAIFTESAGCCVYCGWPASTLDHIIPRSFGGSDARYNLVASCALCNTIANDKIFDDIDQKRAYIQEQLALPRFRNRRQLSRCIECDELFRQGWQGATALLCAKCNKQDLSRDKPSKKHRKDTIARTNKALAEEREAYKF